MRTPVFAVLIAVSIVTGCASRGRHAPEPAREQIAVAGKADADRLWSVALKTVSVRFPVKSAQEAAGTIETDYLIGPLSETGFKVNVATGRDLAYDMLHTTRRRALVTVGRDGGTPLAVCVYRQRLVRPVQEALPAGTYSLDLTRGRDSALVKQRWVDEGRDGALERLIEREIAARYRAGAS